MERAIAVVALTGAVLFGGATTAGAAHQSAETPSGCHDTASQSAEKSGGRSQWNNNAGSQADENSPVIRSGTC